MDKQAILSGYQDQIRTDECVMVETVCLGKPTIEGLLHMPAEDKLLEKNLVFDVSNDVPLTRREEEILRLIVSGQTNKQIARRLSRSERTIEYHRNRLMRKVGAHNAAQLVKGALVMGLG
jgi:two-component system secretion response regulator SsrB